MTLKIIGYVAVMAGVTYLIRMLPFVIFRKKIKSCFIRSFLYYVPYSVLGAMTIPEIFYSTGDRVSAAAGFILGAILALKKKSLIVVALGACIAAYAAILVMKFI